MTARLFSLSITATILLVLAQACRKEYDMKISDKYRKSVPLNVQLLDYTSKSLTIAWDFMPEATSYTVQLLGSPDDEMPLHAYVARTEDYYEFSGLEPRKGYYARVRANFPYSATSEWVYVMYQENQPAKLIPLYGLVAPDFEIPYFRILDSTSSTITAEWSFTGFESQDTEISDTYSLFLYEDEAGNNLHISWENVSGLFAASTAATPKPLRFTFTGLTPNKTYYLKVKNLTKNLESGLKKVQTTAAIPQAAANPTASGDIVLSQDFSRFIHGGDIVFKAAGYTVGTAAGRSTWQPASGPNPVDATRGQAPCDLNTEFNVFDGGNVTAAYTQGVGMENWGKQGNTSTRPGYIKIGGGSALGALYTPELSKLNSNANLVIRFKASVYTEATKAYCDRILVRAVTNATFDAKGNITNAGSVTELQSTNVTIADAIGFFKEYTVTFSNIPPNARIVFSSEPADVSANKTRFLLDDVVVAIQ